MDYEVELVAGRAQTEEALVVRRADGSEERMRLHEYDRVYAIPGLYEEVVQRRLRCESPDKLADLLVACAADAGLAPGDLAVYDLGAGNGVSGEALRARGIGTLVASDASPVARDAAERDRPGLYAEYFVGDTDDVPEARASVAEHGLNALVAVAALGLGHITAASFDRLWGAFAPGSWFAVSVREDLAKPGGSDFGDYLTQFGTGSERGELLVRERFRHRLTMSGEPIWYEAIVARRPPG